MLASNQQTYSQNQEHFYQGQTVTFLTIVMLQIFGNLLATRTHVKSSLFQQTPWRKNSRNLWIFAAQLISLVICLVIVFVSFFQNLFSTRSIPVGFVFLPLGFCFIVVGLDEIRKWCVRAKLFCFHKIGW